MHIEILNIGLALIEGLTLILSPCILPILPIILAGSLSNSKKRPFGIVLGFVVSFALFTYFSRELVLAFGIDINIIRNISLSLLFILGVIMISDYLIIKLEQITQGFANIGSSPTEGIEKNGFFHGFWFGCIISFVWTPCAGPILAAVIVQTILQKTTLDSFLTIFSFSVGAAIPMLIIILFGRTILKRVSFLKQHAEYIRKILGILIIASVVFMKYGYGLPNSFNTITGNANHNFTNASMTLTNGLKVPFHAPAIADIESWINSKPLQLEQLKGKVVLIDFWAYSCINCIRTLPHLKDWYKKYQERGLVIIGIHSPEFEFERNVNNVKSAVLAYGIQYPVALDNSFRTWQNYQNLYWPAHYLINKNGDVVYLHYGEGDYDITENNIRVLLGIDSPISKAMPLEKVNDNETPETYLGYARAHQFKSPESMGRDNLKKYTFPKQIPTDGWALQGAWMITPEKIVSMEAYASIKIHFTAGKVFAVMGNNSNKTLQAKVLLNGNLVTTENGVDVKDGILSISHHTLYSLIELRKPSDGILEIITEEPGLEIYTFTFGP